VLCCPAHQRSGLVGGGKAVLIKDFMRRFATPPFVALRNTVLKLLLNTNATGQGGN
jgi:hypothetical protein